MNKFGVILQPITILLATALLVLVIIDLYTFEWGRTKNGYVPFWLSQCTPWDLYGCSQFWMGISISRRVGLILHICLIPLTVTMILVSSLAVFTRVMRKQTAILILILISWITLSTLIATVVLRRIINTSSTTVITFDYQYHWQIYITLASFIIAFLLTQIFAFGGYFRPMITMLSFDGHYQRYDYPRMSKLERNMVSVKELDNF